MPGMRPSLAKVDDYPALLNEAWAQHLAPRADNAPTVISTFAGAGGSSLGYSMAGFRELLAVEWDDNAVETFRLNFPEVPVYHGDIAALSVEEVLRLTGLKPGELDVFDGSPPCQGFSTAGKRQMDDPRNSLFREFVRLLRGLRPKVFVMENVSGMVKGKMKLVFAEIMRELKASGYVVSARLLNAMYFGVPQSRQRMIFVGVRADLGIAPSHPRAQTKPVGVLDALGWDGRIEWFTGFSAGDSRSFALPAPIVMKDGIGGSGHSKYRLISNSSYKETLKPIDMPCPTITKTAPEHSVAMLGGSAVARRRFEIDEVKRIASFPGEFNLIGKYAEQWARIGNSVPPLFMRAIAQHIRSELLP